MATMAEDEVLGPAELAARLGSVQLIDVRSRGEFAGGHIRGARSIPLDELAARAAEIDAARPVVFVCQSGGRSAKACAQARALGRGGANLEGGMSAWVRAGLPVDKKAGAPWALERQVRVVAGSLVLVGVGLGWFVHPGFFALSAFVGAGLVFAGVTDWCGMGLLLARAPWNRG